MKRSTLERALSYEEIYPRDSYVPRWAGGRRREKEERREEGGGELGFHRTLSDRISEEVEIENSWTRQRAERRLRPLTAPAAPTLKQ
eukprot:scaffold44551_cov44-Tisochrysis_lutea.AAC.1